MKRTGECACGVAACCKVIAMPIPHPRAVRVLPGVVIVPMLAQPAASFVHFLDVHGVGRVGDKAVVPVPMDKPATVKIGHYGKALVAYIESACQQLADDGTCKLYGSPERPAACAAYPTALADLQEVKDVCTYHFEDG